MVSIISNLAVIVAALPIVLSSSMRETRAESAKNVSIGVQAAPKFIDGPWQNFPAIDTWLTFDKLFDLNKNSMKSKGSTWDDIGRINVAIRECAKLGVDERVILGIIMQESHGDVGVNTTTSPGGIPTRGLMQCSGCDGFPFTYGLSQVNDSAPSHYSLQTSLYIALYVCPG
jgi:hypothetical protein